MIARTRQLELPASAAQLTVTSLPSLESDLFTLWNDRIHLPVMIATRPTGGWISFKPARWPD